MFTRKLFPVLVLVIAAPAVADTRALVFGNEFYAGADRVAGAAGAMAAAEALGEAGFEVISGQDLETGAMRAGLAELIEAEEPERLVILLAGHFATSPQATWFLGTEADRPSFATVDGVGLQLSAVLGVAAGTPGGAVVLLATGSEGEADLPLGTGLRAGIGAFDIPQGVTVIRGETREVVAFARDALTTPDENVPELLTDWPDLTAEGFLSRLLPFLPTELLPDPETAEDRTARAEAEERALWDEVRQADTLDAYERYLARYPEGRFANTARTAIDRLVASPEEIEAALGLGASQRREIQRQLNLLGFNTRGVDGIFGPGTRGAITGWQERRGLPATGFLSEGQLSLLAEDARRRQAEIDREEEERRLERERNDRAFWRDTGSGSDEAGLRTYLERYPQGLFADVARERLAEYDAARDRRAWGRARDDDTAAAYRRYLEDHPEGAYADRARARLEELTRAERAERDRRAWEDAQRRDTVDAYRAYLDAHPQGAFVSQARERLDQLAGARDRRAWDEARAQDTARAYRQYLDAFPDGAFAAAARERLAELTRDDDAQARAAEEALNLSPFTRQLIEMELRAQGFDPGRIDGRFDADTRAAIRSYQSARGLPVTGYVTQQMLSGLIAGVLPFSFN